MWRFAFLIVFLVCAARGQQPWVQGDPHIMEIPRPPLGLPSFPPNWRARFTGNVLPVPNEPTRAIFCADDWWAVGTRQVGQVDLWVVWGDDYSHWRNTRPGEPFPHGGWVLAIYTNENRCPADLIWTHYYPPTDYIQTRRFDDPKEISLPGPQASYYLRGTENWQYTFTLADGPTQQDGRGYWLAIYSFDPYYDGIITVDDALLPAGWRQPRDSGGEYPMAATIPWPGSPPVPPPGSEYTEFYYTPESSLSVAFVVSAPGDSCSAIPPCGPADLTAGAVAGVHCYGVPNGTLNNEDFFYYLAQFAGQNLFIADTTTSAVPGSPGYGVPNGILNNEDFFYYLTLFAQGC
ncbi:MAG: hypothetical protein H6809_07720 [Phycisphaeraceae bacterium]|nr:hypothetical protein [Phycisphaeraceae bacterium]